MATASFVPKAKVLKYETFLNDVLKEDLRKILEQRDKVYAEMSEFAVLKNTILRLQETNLTKTVLKTKIDLGCNFYASAVVPDCEQIFVKIGFGFFLELTLDEALTFIEKKNKQLETVADSLGIESAKVKANIKLVLEGLRELQLTSNDNRPARKNIF